MSANLKKLIIVIRIASTKSDLEPILIYLERLGFIPKEIL
jgi:hypothetical protein